MGYVQVYSRLVRVRRGSIILAGCQISLAICQWPIVCGKSLHCKDQKGRLWRCYIRALQWGVQCPKIPISKSWCPPFLHIIQISKNQYPVRWSITPSSRLSDMRPATPPPKSCLFSYTSWDIGTLDLPLQGPINNDSSLTIIFWPGHRCVSVSVLAQAIDL